MTGPAVKYDRLVMTPALMHSILTAHTQTVHLKASRAVLTGQGSAVRGAGWAQLYIHSVSDAFGCCD